MRQAVPKKGSQLGFRANADCLAEIEREFLFQGCRKKVGSPVN